MAMEGWLDFRPQHLAQTFEWQALSESMNSGVSGSTRIRRRIVPHGTNSPQKRQRWPE